MEIQKIEGAAKVAKDISEAAKNFQSIVENILKPRGVDLALIEGHKKIIDNYIERDDIGEEAKMAFLSNYKKQIKEFKNCTSVSKLAMEHISEDAKPHEVEEDWFAFFFDKVRIVSNEAVQKIWAQVLANEVNTPGKYTRSLLHTLSIMSFSQAELFSNIVRFCMYEYRNEDIVHPFLFVSKNVHAYENSRISDIELMDLEKLGLIQCDFKDEFIFPKKKVLRYGNKVIEIHGDPQNDDKIYAGNVRFTYDGQMLFRIVGEDYKRYREQILNFTIAKLQRRNCTVYVNNQKVT